MIKRTCAVLVSGLFLAVVPNTSAFAGSNSNTLDIPGGAGSIRSDVWRSDGSNSGSTRQWDYQVSATYEGGNSVEFIKTTWSGGASLRNGASFTLGVSADGVTVGASSSWQHAEVGPRYWQNDNGATTSSWRSNEVVGPEQDYLSDSVFNVNLATVKLYIDARTFEVNAST